MFRFFFFFFMSKLHQKLVLAQSCSFFLCNMTIIIELINQMIMTTIESV